MADRLKADFPFSIFPNDLFELELNPYEISIYIYLCRCSNNSTAFPSYNTIAIKTGMSRPKAINTIKDLISKGLVKKHLRMLDNNDNESNIYEVSVNNLVNEKYQGSKQDLLGVVNEKYQGSKQDLPYKELNDKELIINNIVDFFEKLWSEYPNKKGKANVTKKSKEYFYKLGLEKSIELIKRYKKYVDERRKEFPALSYKNGSTFFNSGYVDYLDENYTEYKAKIEYKKPTQATNYEQRKYDDEFFNSIYDNVEYVKE